MTANASSKADATGVKRRDPAIQEPLKVHYPLLGLTQPLVDVDALSGHVRRDTERTVE
jgi:hypothetical protein